jgi:hypothetical protein
MPVPGLAGWGHVAMLLALIAVAVTFPLWRRLMAGRES